MKSIGFRATTNEVIYCIVEENSGEPKVLAVDKIKVPSSQDFPEKLSFLRTTTKDIIREYNINYAGIRTTENNSRNWSIARISMEGVLQELFCKSSIEKYFIGQSSSITSKLRIDAKDFLKIVKKEINTCCGIDLTRYNDGSTREAILVAIAAIKL